MMMMFKEKGPTRSVGFQWGPYQYRFSPALRSSGELIDFDVFLGNLGKIRHTDGDK